MALCTLGWNFSKFSRNLVPPPSGSGDLRITVDNDRTYFIGVGVARTRWVASHWGVVVTWTVWGLGIRAGMGVQLSCIGGGRVRSTCKYQQEDRTCTPILALIWRPHLVHITTTPTVLFPSTPTYTPYVSACLLFLVLQYGGKYTWGSNTNSETTTDYV